MQKNEIIHIRITDINNLGSGVGHLASPNGTNGQTVFLRGGVTGEEWEASVIKVAKSYLVARPLRLLTPSPHRIEQDPCTAAASCGGCAYRHVAYAHEAERKRHYVQTAFKKAGLADVVVEEVRGTGKLTGYRNKAQYPVQKDSNGKTVAGFYANSSHRVVAAEHCALQPILFSKLVAAVCAFCDRYHISAYEEASGTGLLRHIYLRTAEKTGEVMLCLVLNGRSLPHEREFVSEFTTSFPQIASLMINCNTQNTNVVLGEEYRLLYGKPYITDVLCGVGLRIPPEAFYQVNHGACELLYGLAKERAALTGKELLLDLYCGIGSIGLSMADQAGEVLGMEIVEGAAMIAKENAVRNGITNAAFFCGDAGDPNGLLTKAAEERGSLADSVVVIDPPRKGTTESLIRAIATHKIRRVVYVSCNPDTLARDCAVFRSLGYRIGTVTPVDLFPRTGHVESVVLIYKED